MRVSESITTYLRVVDEALRATEIEALESVVRILRRALEEGQRVYVFGNGACAALASHLAADLGKSTAFAIGDGPEAGAERRLRTIALSDNTAWLTALGNDVGYEDVFLEQLKNHLEASDVVIGLSASGRSPSVVRAMQYAALEKATTIGFTGQGNSSHVIAQYCDVCLKAPTTAIEHIEDLHVIYHHAIVQALLQQIANESEPSE